MSDPSSPLSALIQQNAPAAPAPDDDEQYEGAIVLEPHTGYHDTHVGVGDFRSLYPSIIIAHNLC